MNRKKVEHWLKKNRSLLNYSAIEREAKLAKGILQKFMKYDRKLNDETIKAISDIIHIVEFNTPRRALKCKK